jgi:hypothetical protein
MRSAPIIRNVMEPLRHGAFTHPETVKIGSPVSRTLCITWIFYIHKAVLSKWVTWWVHFLSPDLFWLHPDFSKLVVEMLYSNDDLIYTHVNIGI